MSTESSSGRSPRQAQSGPEPEPPADTPELLGSQVPSKEKTADPLRKSKPCPVAEPLSLGAGRGSHFQQHDAAGQTGLKVKPAAGQRGGPSTAPRRRTRGALRCSAPP